MYISTNTNDLWVSTIDCETLSFKNEKSCPNVRCLSCLSYPINPEMTIKNTRDDLFLSPEMICSIKRKTDEKDYIMTRFKKFIILTRLEKLKTLINKDIFEKSFVVYSYTVSDKKCHICNSTMIGEKATNNAYIGNLVFYPYLVSRHFEICRMRLAES